MSRFSNPSRIVVALLVAAKVNAGSLIKVIDKDQDAPVQSRIEINARNMGSTQPDGILKLRVPCKASDLVAAIPLSADYVKGAAYCNSQGDQTQVTVYRRSVLVVLEAQFQHAKHVSDLSAESILAREISGRYKGIDSSQVRKYESEAAAAEVAISRLPKSAVTKIEFGYLRDSKNWTYFEDNINEDRTWVLNGRVAVDWHPETGLQAKEVASGQVVWEVPTSSEVVSRPLRYRIGNKTYLSVEGSGSPKKEVLELSDNFEAIGTAPMAQNPENQNKQEGGTVYTFPLRSP